MLPNDLLHKATMNQGVEKFGDMADLIRSEHPEFAEIPFIIIEGNSLSEEMVQAFSANDPDSPLPGRQVITLHPSAEQLERKLVRDMVVTKLFEAVTGEVPNHLAFPEQVDMEKFRPPKMGAFQVEGALRSEVSVPHVEHLDAGDVGTGAGGHLGIEHRGVGHQAVVPEQQLYARRRIADAGGGHNVAGRARRGRHRDVTDAGIG